jgi:hypothetical protein
VAVTITKPSFPFRGTPAFYSGTGATQLVPNIFPVAINGRPYMVDVASNDFASQFDARVRDSVDQSTEPGESAINPQGLWRRSQSSWHYGAGQEYSDTADAEPFRFRSSKGVDVWTRGELSLLPDTTQVYASTATNLYMATAGNRIYGTEGQTVQYTTDFVSFTTVTGTNASDLYSITSNGYHVFFSYADGNIDQTNAGTSAASDYITGISAGLLRYVKGRLMVAGQGNDKHKIWNIVTAPGSTANNPAALYTHPNAQFTWVGFAAGQNHIYAAGHAGNKSIIYKTTIQADGTALQIPTVAGELPFGEIVTTIEGYLGFVLIGLENGFRFCSSDENGNLVIGPLVRTGTSVNCFSGVGQFVYFGWTNYDSASTGIGRMNVADQVSVNQPAYASDLMVAGQGAVLDLHEFGDAPIFTISGLGAYRQDPNDLVSSGTLDTGIYRWGVGDAKFVPKWDIRTEPLNGTVELSVANDNGLFDSVGAQTVQGSLESTFDGVEARIFEAEARLTLTCSSIDSTLGPVVTRWMGRAYAAPLRSKIFSVPVLLHSRIRVKNGSEFFFDVRDELEFLEGLVDNPRIVAYQENNKVYSVVVEDVRWRPVDSGPPLNEWTWDGTATVIMRSVR